MKYHKNRMAVILVGFCLFAGINQMPAKAGTNASLVGWWGFDNIVKDEAEDGAGHDYYGIIVNAESVKGKVGQALRFHGNIQFPSYVTVPPIALPREFSVSAWINPEDLSPAVILSQYNCNYCGFILALKSYTGKPEFSVRTPYKAEVPAISSTAVKTGEWSFVSATYGRGKACLYLNGKLEASVDAEMTMEDVALFIGKRGWTDDGPFNGSIDEVKVYEGVLSAEEIQAIYTNSAAQPTFPTPRQIEKSVVLPAAKTSVSNNAAIVLAADGQPAATIVIARDANGLQRRPARDLQQYIYRISGARLPIVTDDTNPAGALVLVGASRYTREMGIDMEQLTGDAFVIRSAADRLALAGRDRRCGRIEIRGTANAVNVFLEDYCGVRRFMPGTLGEIIPSSRTLEIPAIDKMEKPFRLYASLPGADRSATLWSTCNWFGNGILLHPSLHSWTIMIPREIYFEQHPEWFAMIDGKRTGGWSPAGTISRSHHLCTSNPEMRQEALKNLKAICAQGYEIITVGQTDGFQRCQCKECEAQDEWRGCQCEECVFRSSKCKYREGGAIPKTCDRIWLFDDYLARGIARDYPDVKLMFLSYHPTIEPPKALTNFPSNVVIELCQSNPDDIARWKAFQNLPPFSYYCHYVYWFFLPQAERFPVSFTYVASEYKRLASLGTTGFVFDVLYWDWWGMNAPTYYLLGQLLRNPAANTEDILREFCQGLFESSWKPMNDYFFVFNDAAEKLIRSHEAMAKIRAPLGIQSAVRYACFTPYVLNRCEADLETAMLGAPNDSVRKRIQFFRDGFDYVKFIALAFDALTEYADNPSDKKLLALKQAVERRNQFVQAMYQRQKANRGELPDVTSGCLEGLLYPLQYPPTKPDEWEKVFNLSILDKEIQAISNKPPAKVNEGATGK